MMNVFPEFEQNIPHTSGKQETQVYRVTINQAVEENWLQDKVNSRQTHNETVEDCKSNQGNTIVTEATVELPPKHIRAELGDSNKRMEDIIEQFKTQNSSCRDPNPFEALVNNLEIESQEEIISVVAQNQERKIERKQPETGQYEMNW